jgi:exonuclease VII small subunit
MTKKPPRRQRPTFAAIADRVRQEVTEEFEAWWAVEKQVILESARMEYEHAYSLLSKHATALEQENAQLREPYSLLSKHATALEQENAQLRAVESSWLKALGSWIRRLWS